MDYEIREATIKDIEVINDLFLEMLRAIYHHEPEGGYEENYLLENYFQSEKNVIYVAESDGSVVAFLSVEYHSDDKMCYLYLDDCCVAPVWRGKGIGTKLFSCADEYAEKCGVREIYLHAEKSNSAAISLYKRLGYTQCDAEGSRIKMVKTKAGKTKTVRRIR